MDKKTAEARAKKLIEIYKLINRPLTENEFKFDYNGPVEDAELMWHFIYMNK